MEINKILNKSCIGIAYMDITCDNIKYALPNKLFEYIQAGVIPIVNINNLDAANLVNKYKLGLVDNSDKKINSLPILSSDHFINEIRMELHILEPNHKIKAKQLINLFKDYNFKTNLTEDELKNNINTKSTFELILKKLKTEIDNE